MGHFQITYKIKQLLKKKFSDLMLSSESDEMTAVWLFMQHSQVACQSEQALKKKFLIQCLV